MRSLKQIAAHKRNSLLRDLTGLAALIQSRMHLFQEAEMPEYRKRKFLRDLAYAKKELEYTAKLLGWKGPKVFNEETGEFEHAKTGKS